MIVTTSLMLPPARFTTLSIARKITRAWPFEIAGHRLAVLVDQPGLPDTQTILPPSVTTPGEKPRDCARSCLR